MKIFVAFVLFTGFVLPHLPMGIQVGFMLLGGLALAILIMMGITSKPERHYRYFL